MILSRIERNEASDVDQDMLEALAEELGLGEADLGEAPLWTWVTFTPSGQPTFVSVGLRQLLFSSPEAAYDARDLLAHELREGNPLRGAELLHPIFRSGVVQTLEANFGELTDLEQSALTVIDPTPRQLRELVTYAATTGAPEREMRRGKAQALFEAATGGMLETLLTPDQLYALSARRLSHAKDVSPDLKAQWQLETDRLLDAEVEWQKERRKQLEERFGEGDSE